MAKKKQCPKQKAHPPHEWVDDNLDMWKCEGLLDYVPGQKKGGW